MSGIGRTHQDYMELLGAYALDAVDGDELVELEDHLRTCPRCRAEVEQHREVAAQLAFVGEAAPQGLWHRIAESLEPAEPEPGLGAVYPLRAGGAAAARRGARWTRPALVAALVAMLVGFGALGWEVHHQADRVSAVSAALRTGSVQRLMNAASLDPTSRRVALVSADGRVRLNVVLAADGTGYLATNGTLPALSSDRTYQLWGLTPASKVSLGVIGPAPSIVTFAAFPGSPRGLQRLAVTDEAAGGAIQPTGAVLASGVVPT